MTCDRHGALLALVAAVATWSLASAALASPVAELLGKTSDAGGSTLDDPAALQKRALTSFEITAQQLAKELLPANMREDDAHSARVRAEAKRFAAAVQRNLNELAGDGVLTLSEVQSELAALRKAHINQLQESLRALKDGAPHPPRRKPNEGWWSFTARQLDYTFSVRNDPERFLWLLLVLAASEGLVWSMSFVVRRRLGEQGASKRSLGLLARLRGPVYLSLMAAAAALGMTWIWMPIELSLVTEKVLLLVAGLAVLWAVWSTSEVLPHVLGGHSLGQHGRDLWRTMTRTLGVLLFAMFVVEVIVGTDFTALIAGFGLVGIALTLAAQDSLKNLFGAGTIHADSLFRVGELVKFADYFGTIEHIGFRSVKLRTLDGTLVTIPNAKLVAEAVENVEARPYIRRFFEISIVYGTSTEKVLRAIQIIRQTLQEAEFVLDDPAYHVAFHELAAYSLDLLVTYYHREPDWWKAKENDTELNLKMLQRFREEGIQFALPTHTLHLPEQTLRGFAGSRSGRRAATAAAAGGSAPRA